MNATIKNLLLWMVILVLIILADQLGRSVGDMYAGAIIPGLALTAMYVLYVFGRSIVSPERLPALPLEARSIRGWKDGGGISARGGGKRLSSRPRVA